MSTRHSRQSFLGDNSEDVLIKSRIGIVGLCGGGSHVGQQLAHIGVGKIVAADFDHVEDPNLNRMVGSCPADAESNRLKNDVVRELILRINPNADVEIVGRWQERGDLLRICDILIGCVDSFTARDELEKFCRRFLIPYIDIGMDVHQVSTGYGISGQVALSIPGGHCLWCHGILTKDRLEQQEQRKLGGKQEQTSLGVEAVGHVSRCWRSPSGPRLQFLVITKARDDSQDGVLASIAVGHAVSLLLPWNTDLPMSSLIEYDGNRHITRPARHGARLQFLKDVPCPHYKGEGSIGDPFFRIDDLSLSVPEPRAISLSVPEPRAISNEMSSRGLESYPANLLTNTR
jgi:hypothetical protein